MRIHARSLKPSELLVLVLPGNILLVYSWANPLKSFSLRQTRGDSLSQRGLQISKTEVIPIEVLQPLFQAAKAMLDRADELLEVHNKLLAIEKEADRYAAKNESNQANQRKYIKRKYLDEIGQKDGRSLSLACIIHKKR